MTTPLWQDLREPPTRLRRWQALIRKQPSAVLLLVQLLAILGLPYLESNSDYGRLIFSGISAVTLMVAVFTVRSTPALTWLAVVLFIPAFSLDIWSAAAETSGALTAAAHGAMALFYFYTAYGLIAYMFEDAWVTKDELFAVGACFTVLLFAFAYLYLATQEIWKGSFMANGGIRQASFMELLYFSGANLTGCGLSDIIPVRSHARSVTTIEQLGGILYIAMVITRLIALTVMRNRD